MASAETGATLIRQKFNGLGITLTDDQITEIEQKLLKIDLSTLMPPDTPSIGAHRKHRTLLQTQILRVWQKPLALLEMFLVLARESGEQLNREISTTAPIEQDYVFEVLTRLHARAGLIASEILVLLQTGHADGAHARWRSLHEIAVVGRLIRACGNEIAKRYLLHDTVESFRIAKQYQTDAAALGYDPIPDEAFAEIETTYLALLRRFGASFKGNYGWASAALGKDKPTFRDIEEKVGLDHLRPFYELASHNIHANPKGLFFRLGLYPDQDVPLSGPSITGLAEPGRGTAISLGQITISFLTTRPTIDRLVMGEVLMKLSDEIGEEFQKTQQSLEAD